jgi:hypothetical protein
VKGSKGPDIARSPNRGNARFSRVAAAPVGGFD